MNSAKVLVKILGKVLRSTSRKVQSKEKCELQSAVES